MTPPLFAFTPPDELTEQPKRIILHWTAGTYLAEPFQAEGDWHNPALHYHGLVEWLAAEERTRVVAGPPIAANMRRLTSTDPSSSKTGDRLSGYAAHTGGWNSYSIGLAVCGMKDAWARHAVELSQYPIRPEQIDAIVTIAANACAIYRLPVDVDHVFTHYEAWAEHDDENHSDRWDIGWLPQEPGIELDDVGPWLREQIQGRLS